MLSARRLLPVLLCGPLLAASGLAQSQARVATDSFQVRIDVQGSCSVVTASDIYFGDQASGVGSYTQTGTIKVQCTKDLPFYLGLDGGTTTGMVDARAMGNGAGVQIPYTLSRGGAGGQNWGNDAGSWYAGSGGGLGSQFEISLTVFASATLAGDEPPGTYVDMVTATLTY